VTVDEDRRRTAGARRGLIIKTLSRELDATRPTSASSRLDRLLEDQTDRPLIVSGDIDGLVSAGMLAAVAKPGWRAVALVLKSGQVLVHPDHADDLELTDCFGVDVYSTYFDNVSNHVALWGGKRPDSDQAAFAAAQAYDDEVLRRSGDTLLASPSLWARIQGSQSGAAGTHDSAGYRYPLGTAQVLLAMLEAVGRSPRMFDREYLPWLIANCDGGLASFARYPHNVPLWWSCLAAAVGPASLSEAIYQTAARQAPIDFVHAVNKLRAETQLVDGGPASALNDSWNLQNQDPDSVRVVVSWISSLSGWPDPFLGGAESLDAWITKSLDHRGTLSTSGLPLSKDDPPEDRVAAFKGHLRASLDAVHTNFAHFDGQQRLNWVAPWDGAEASHRPAVPAVLADPATGSSADLANAAKKNVVI